MKRKSNFKKIIIISFLCLIAICIIATTLFLNSKKLTFNYESKIELKLKTETFNTDNIKDLKNGTIITNREKINTTKIGTQEINIEIKNYFGKVSKISYQIIVIDNESPVITFNKELRTEEGVTIDLLKDVKVTDNSEEEITPTIEGIYDFNESGEYNLFYVAKDSSGNETREAFTLTVKEKIAVQKPIEKPKENPTEKPNVTTPSDDKETPSNNQTNSDKTFTTSKGFSGVTKNGVTYIDGYLVVNKTYSLPSNYGNGLTKETKDAFEKMKSAATLEGLNVYLSSGYRSYTTQNNLYNRYVNRDGKAEADKYSARPGHSEHQSGLAFDVNQINNTFDNSAEAKWLAANCYKYGFILRYPKGKTNETGYIYESWHFRYVGTELATKLYNNGDWITMEDYFGITSEYK